MRKEQQLPDKYDTLTQCWSNGGPPSTTLAHRWVDVLRLLGTKPPIQTVFWEELTSLSLGVL